MYNRPPPKSGAFHKSTNISSLKKGVQKEPSDLRNYILLIALYTIQGIPMGLSASIPLLIQQKIQSGSSQNSDLSRSAYNAQAIFALCSWPFSLKLLWAPIVDSVFWKPFGKRKSWLVPVQFIAGITMIMGSDYVESHLGLSESGDSSTAIFDIRGVTVFFFALYFLMATQDIAVDGWALTMLSRKNKGKGPVCNSIGQNIGYFLSFVGFLALNDADSSENLWRPLLRLESQPGVGLVSLGGFIRFMGIFMLIVTCYVAIFKNESANLTPINDAGKDDDDEMPELDASEIGLVETYRRLWQVCKLPSVRSLFLVLLTYRLPTALSDNVKFLKAIEFGLSKQTTALLNPAIILPLGILVPIIGTKIWRNHPFKQFLHGYKVRVTLVPLLDILMLLSIRHMHNGVSSNSSGSVVMFWGTIIISTALQATVSSLQVNALMSFFATRVDPAIGGSYMTLLNTAANLGGTWPSSLSCSW